MKIITVTTKYYTDSEEFIDTWMKGLKDDRDGGIAASLIEKNLREHGVSRVKINVNPDVGVDIEYRLEICGPTVIVQPKS